MRPPQLTRGAVRFLQIPASSVTLQRQRSVLQLNSTRALGPGVSADPTEEARSHEASRFQEPLSNPRSPGSQSSTCLSADLGVPMTPTSGSMIHSKRPTHRCRKGLYSGQGVTEAATRERPGHGHREGVGRARARSQAVVGGQGRRAPARPAQTSCPHRRTCSGPEAPRTASSRVSIKVSLRTHD